MTAAQTRRVVVDTGVFGAGLTAQSLPLAARYAPLLVGQEFFITVQTISELYFGALRANWGEIRRRQLEQRIRRAVIIPADEPLAITCAQLRLTCLQQGHPLAQKIHTNDLWIAAAAVHYRLPLVSDDRVFAGVPELDLRAIPHLT